MSFSGLLDNTCETLRATPTRGALGTSKAYASHLTGVPCRLQQSNGDELATETDNLQSLVAQHKLWFPYGTDIVARDRVTVGSVTYEVIDVDANVAGAQHHGAARLLEVR